MSTKISELLDELRSDHRNMARLLDLLEKEGDEIYSDGAPNLELMRDVMRYMTVYPDAVHHPREDRLYAELRAARPEWAEGMSRISGEHRALEEQGAGLLDRLEQALAGDTDALGLVVTDALRYVDLLRKHMRWEESDLFKRLDRMVAEGHDAISKSVVVDRPDPLFAGDVEERFKTLYRRITG